MGEGASPGDREDGVKQKRAAQQKLNGKEDHMTSMMTKQHTWHLLGDTRSPLQP